MADVVGLQKFLKIELEKYEPEIIDTIYPEYWGDEGSYCPTYGDLDVGLRKIVYARMDTIGRAVNTGSRPQTIPLVNFGITMEESNVVIGILAAEWSYFDLEAEKVAKKFPQLFQGRDLIRNYRKALEKGLREWMNIRAIFGDASIGFQGMFTNSRVTVINETQNLNTMSATDLYNWFLTRLNAFRKANYLTAKTTAIMMSTDMKLALSRRFADASGDGNPMKLLQPLVGNLIEVNELSAPFLETYGALPPGTNKDMMIFYQNDPEVLDRHYSPIEITEPGLLDDQLTTRIVGFCATSETRVKQPLRMQYITYPKAA